MFPPARARGLRYKAILSDCRKQSQEMEMHCVTLSATSGYLFGQICVSFFFLLSFSWESPSLHLSWNPRVDVWEPEEQVCSVM